MKASRPAGTVAVCLLLALEVLLWAVLLGPGHVFRAGPDGKSLATDFAVFSGAADALRHGKNPYDNRVLYGYERGLMLRQHLPVTHNVTNVRAGNPPLFYWALEPLTRLPFQSAAFVWIAALLAVSALGLMAALMYFGWNRRLVPVAVFLLMPQTALGAAYGNIHGLVLAALAGALALGRRAPAAGGALLALTWLKPQLGLPLAALIMLFHTPEPWKMAAGFVAATGALLGATLAVLGAGPLLNWIQGLVSWSHTVGLEPNLASLVGLYVGWAPASLRLALEFVALAAAVVCTARVWWTLRGEGEAPFMRVAWLWAIWFLASPFAHFPDEILLAIPLLAYLGVNGRNLRFRGPIAALYLSVLSLVLFPATLFSVNFLSVIVAAIGILLYRDRTGSVHARD